VAEAPAVAVAENNPVELSFEPVQMQPGDENKRQLPKKHDGQ
jgi:hypothetical protein